MGAEIKGFYDEKAEEYFKDNGKKIYKMVDNIIFRKYGSINGRDMQEYYSLANDVFWDIARNDRYREGMGDYNGYLYRSLELAIIDEYKRATRDKRVNKIEVEEKNNKGENVRKKIPIEDVRMDAPINEDGVTIGDTISSDSDVEQNVMRKLKADFERNTNEYIDVLTNRQKKIVYMIMEGYKPKEIKKDLELTNRQFQSDWGVIISYDKIRHLFRRQKECTVMDDDKIITSEDTHEKFKDKHYSISSIDRQLCDEDIRDNHILQRHSGQWKPIEKSVFVSDILKGKSLTQIIIDEEIRNSIRMYWLIDGKQRCTTISEFLHNGFAISKSLKESVVTYYEQSLDEDGNKRYNEEKFPIYEAKSFDLKGKRFKDLPLRLQNIFNDREIPILLNIDCTKKNIVDDIRRFNMSRPLNVAQSGWLGLDECLADYGERITQMPFFQSDFKGSSYTNNQVKSGAIRRLVIESVFVSDFLDNYEKDFKKKCEYLSEEADSSNFTDLYLRIERLQDVCGEDVADMFNIKDSFLYFGLFARFDNYGVNDRYFVDFLMAFKSELHNKAIDGVAYDDVDINSTKDKNVVQNKMKCLENLLKEYLVENVKDAVIRNGNEEPVTAESLIREYINANVTEQDINDYEEDLETLTVEVDNNSKLLDESNKPSLIAMVAYGYALDESIDKWFIGYFKDHLTYIKDQKKNLEAMMNDYDKYKNNQVA
jgi:DNA-directed RNA polymerase specialized sigma24 family protein